VGSGQCNNGRRGWRAGVLPACSACCSRRLTNAWGSIRCGILLSSIPAFSITWVGAVDDRACRWCAPFAAFKRRRAQPRCAALRTPPSPLYALRPLRYALPLSACSWRLATVPLGGICRYFGTARRHSGGEYCFVRRFRSLFNRQQADGYARVPFVRRLKHLVRRWGCRHLQAHTLWFACRTAYFKAVFPCAAASASTRPQIPGLRGLCIPAYPLRRSGVLLELYRACWRTTLFLPEGDASQNAKRPRFQTSGVLARHPAMLLPAGLVLCTIILVRTRCLTLFVITILMHAGVCVVPADAFATLFARYGRLAPQALGRMALRVVAFPLAPRFVPTPRPPAVRLISLHR